MRKLLPILLLAVLFISCSSDDNSDDGNKNEKNMIDEKILGKWKVEYSKTIKGARFLEDGTLEIAEGAVVTEYMGDYDGYIGHEPKSGLFDDTEIELDIKEDNTISIHSAGKIDRLIYYRIENGYLKWQGVKDILLPVAIVKYSLQNTTLKMELIKLEGTNTILTYYTISEYSKISE